MRFRTLAATALAAAFVPAVVAQSGGPAAVPGTLASIPTNYHAVQTRTVYSKPALPSLGPAGHRFSDPTFASRMLRVTDGSTRPGYPGRSYSAPSAAHQLSWNATSDRFYIRSLDGWFIPYEFNAATMTASRIQPVATGDGGLLVSSHVEPQFSFVNRDIIFGTTRDQTDPNHDYPVVHKYDFATGTYTTLLNLRLVTAVSPDTYAGALSSSAATPETLSIMFGGPSQDSHFKVAVFPASGGTAANTIVLNTRDSLITRNGKTASTASTLGFLLHHAWIDMSGRYVLLYPVAQQPFSYLVWDLTTDVITPVTTRPFGHDAAGYAMQVNQDCCTSSAQDAAQWQFRLLATPNTTSDLINPVLTPPQTFLADHTSWNNAQPERRVPILSSLYRYYKNTYNTTPWRAWDDEIVAIQTDGGGAVWRFAHHRSNVTNDLGNDGTYFWYQPRANLAPNGRWALFTSNWEKTLGVAAITEPDGIYRTDVFIVGLAAGSFTDDPLVAGVTVVRALHVTELRTRIDVLRANRGLPLYAWTDPSLAAGAWIRAAHIADLRTALEQAYVAAGRTPPAFTDPFLSAGATPIRAVHVEQIRQGVLALEGS